MYDYMYVYMYVCVCVCVCVCVYAACLATCAMRHRLTTRCTQHLLQKGQRKHALVRKRGVPRAQRCTQNGLVLAALQDLCQDHNVKDESDKRSV